MKVVCALILIATANDAGPALAQNYPAKPVRIVVSTPAGGVTDLAARILGNYITARTGQSASLPLDAV